MKWSEVRKTYPNKWILFEAIEAYSQDGKRLIKDLSIINIYNEGKDALKEYSDKHVKDKSKELYVYHTKNEKIEIIERSWIGVRKNG